jgi:hypothetical protein
MFFFKWNSWNSSGPQPASSVNRGGAPVDYWNRDSRRAQLCRKRTLWEKKKKKKAIKFY